MATAAAIKVCKTVEPAMVAGKGHDKAGRTVYGVTSKSEPGRWHLVTVLSGRLQCDCTAAKYGRQCQHRAAVHARLIAERAAAVAQRQAQREAEQAAIEMEEMEAARAHATRLQAEAPKTPREPILFRDVRPFSIFKADYD